MHNLWAAKGSLCGDSSEVFFFSSTWSNKSLLASQKQMSATQPIAKCTHWVLSKWAYAGRVALEVERRNRFAEAIWKFQASGKLPAGR